MASDLPVKSMRRSLVAYWKDLYRDHDKAIFRSLLASALALFAGAQTVSGQREPAIALGMIVLSCFFAVWAAIAWKGISKRSPLNWIIKIGGLVGFFIWSAFFFVTTWRNRPEGKWTTFTWDDVTLVRSYLVRFLATGWKPVLILVALIFAFLIGRRTRRPIQTRGKAAKPFSPEWLLAIAEEDKKQLEKAVKIYAVNCETHFDDPVPHVDFTVWILSVALVVVYIDDTIEPPIIFWPIGYNGEQHKMRREPTMEVNHAKPCLFRWPSKFTIRQDVTPEEVAMISSASDVGFFRLAALKVSLRGETFSGIRLNTELTVKSNGRFWADSPEYIFGGDSERDRILKELYSLWEEGKILLGKAEDGTVEYLDRRVHEWETKTADYLAARLTTFQKDHFLSETNWNTFKPDPARVKRKSNARFLNKIYTRVLRLEDLLKKLSLGSPIVRDSLSL
jgi:hypothetical protein